MPATRADSLDWPQFLGPARNGTYAGPISSAWPKEGPARLWQKEAGQGFAGPVVEGNRLILFHRLESEEVVQCLEASNGNLVWTFKYPTRYRDDFGFDEGPRGTPAIAAGKVFTFGAEGKAHCLDLETGKRLWMVDCQKDFKSEKGFFGMACSPLVENGQVFLNIGGQDGAGVIALDAASGKLLWKQSAHEASYSSPAPATINGQRGIVFFTRSGLLVTRSGDGKALAEYPWRARSHASVNAATPLIAGNQVFLTTSYETGAILLDLSGASPRKLWAGDDLLSSHYATPVLSKGHLYGFDGRQERRPALVCIEFATGKSKWREENFGSGTITLAENGLVIVTENGEIVLAAATPAGFKQLARAQIMPNGVRAFPALARGRLFVRSKDKLASFSLVP